MTGIPENIAADADELRMLICKRLHIQPEDIRCPREKSSMTPCIARDGRLAVCSAAANAVFLCVGCEWRIASLIEKERKMHQ